MKKAYIGLGFLLLLSSALTQAQNTSPFWSLAGNTNATSSSKLGTVNSAPLRLFTKNNERLRIDSTGKVAISTDNPIGKLTVRNNGTALASSWITTGSPLFVGYGEGSAGYGDHILAMASNSPSIRPVSISRRARGSLANPAVVQNNDFLGSYLASGYDGSAFQNPATIDFYVDGVPSAGNVPARISFVTGSNLATRKERLVIKSNGNVGIGTTSPSSPLHVISDGVEAFLGANIYSENTYSGSEFDKYGVYGKSINAPGFGIGVRGVGGFIGVDGFTESDTYADNAYGVYGFAGGTGGSRTGLYGEAENIEADAYGVYGTAYGRAFSAAGYFNGDVYADNYFTTSDRKFKTAITPLKNELKLLMKLKPSSYEFKTAQSAKMALPKGKQMGLIADEVKEVFPELVKQAVHPAKYDRDKKMISSEVKYEAINYQGFIPVLIASAQELYQKTEAENKQLKEEVAVLKEEVAVQKDRLARLEALVTSGANKGSSSSVSAAYLEQNVPNPTDGSTIIRYYIPSNSRSAQLLLTDAKGQTVRRMNLNSKGRAQVIVNTIALAAGAYTYTLFVDGTPADSKQLIIGR